MNPRSTGILAIVAVALGAFVYFYEIGGEVDRKAAEEAGRRVVGGLEAESIEAIELESQDGIPARFVLEDGVWELVQPIEAPADATALDAMTSVLSQLAREGRVDAPGPFEEYGLGENARTIRFEVGGEVRGLRVGRATPVGGHLYVTTLASDEVSFVQTFRLNAFNRNLADLRDRNILPFEPADVTEISLEWPGGEVQLSKPGQNWMMLSPVEEPADEPTIRDLLNDVAFLRAQSFVDEEDEASAASLAATELDLRLTVDGVEQRLTIGASRDGSPIVRGRAARLFRIAPERLEDFERTVPAYRFRTLSKFDGSAARAMTFEFAHADAAGEARRVEAHLDEGGWRASGDIEIDADRFEGVVQALTLLRAITVVADEMGPDERASLGLAPPRSRLRVEAGEGAEGPLADVLLGRVDETRGVYAQRSGDPKIYLLDIELAQSLPVSEEGFEARFLAPLDADADARDVARDEVDSIPTDATPFSEIEGP
jgi:hypothetical protein